MNHVRFMAGPELHVVQGARKSPKNFWGCR
jgi:hypothetical protein